MRAMFYSVENLKQNSYIKKKNYFPACESCDRGNFLRKFIVGKILSPWKLSKWRKELFKHDFRENTF